MRIFVSGMKRAIIIVSYWLAAIFMTALLLTSLDYDLWEASSTAGRKNDSAMAAGRKDKLMRMASHKS